MSELLKAAEILRELKPQLTRTGDQLEPEEANAVRDMFSPRAGGRAGNRGPFGGRVLWSRSATPEEAKKHLDRARKLIWESKERAKVSVPQLRGDNLAEQE